ncbi:MAG: tetratricopeptide repeat protein, partial [Steroidobacter sp.]
NTFRLDSATQPLSSLGRMSTTDFDSLGTEQKYALMLVSIQNGRMDAAMAIADLLAATRKDDLTVRALKAARSIQRYELPAAEAQLKTLVPEDKFETANVELVWALLEMSRSNNRKALQHIDKVLAHLPDHPYAHNVKGVLLVSEKKYDEARRAFEKALKQIPDMDAAETNWGFAELQEGRSVDAARRFDRAISLNHANCQARFGKAILLRDQGNPSSALDVLSTCSANERDMNIRMLVTESMLDLGKNADAAAYLEQSEGLDNNPRARLLMAKAALRNGDMDTALRFAGGDEPQAHYYKSVALLAKGEARNAQNALEPLLKGAQGSASARLLNSIAKLQLDQPVSVDDLLVIDQNKSLGPFVALLNALVATDQATAARYFKNSSGLLQGTDYSAVATDSIVRQLKSKQMADVVAALFFDLMSMQPAMDRFLSKARPADDAFLTQYLLGMRALQSNQPEVAAKHLNKSLQAAPRFFSAQYLLAETYMRSNQLQAALTEYEKALALKAEPGAALKAGVVAERLNKLDVAEKHLRAVVQGSPNNFVGYNQLAWFLASHNRKLDEAVTLAKRATQLLPNDPNTLDTLGWVYYTKGDYSPAVATLKQASQLSDGKNASILFHLAMAEHKAGSNKSALDNAERSKSIGVPSAYSAQLDRLIQVLKP